MTTVPAVPPASPAPRRATPKELIAAVTAVILQQQQPPLAEVTVKALGEKIQWAALHEPHHGNLKLFLRSCLHKFTVNGDVVTLRNHDEPPTPPPAPDSTEGVEALLQQAFEEVTDALARAPGCTLGTHRLARALQWEVKYQRYLGTLANFASRFPAQLTLTRHTVKLGACAFHRK